MSQETVEIVRAALDAYNRGDLEAMLKHAAPDLEFDWSRSVSPQKGVYNLDQFPDFTLAGMFESVRTEPEELIDAGEHVITPLIGYFRSRDGLEVTARFTYLWTFRDGACVRVTIFQARNEALEAAGCRSSLRTDG
jgi:ketosteroid isomerase-like protein